MKRPLLAVALLFVSGILLGAVHAPLTVLFGIALALLLSFLAFAKARLPLLCALVIVAGWIDFTVHTVALSPYDLRKIIGSEPAGATVRGTLAATPRTTLHRDPKTGAEKYRTTTAQVDVTEIELDGHDWQPVRGRIATVTRGEFPVEIYAGQSVELSEVIQPARPPLAQGLFDYRAYLDHEGIYYEMRPKSTDDWRFSWPPDPPPLADRFQAWARKAIALGLPDEDEALRLEWALTLGWKAALTDEVAEPFMQAATYVDF